jgi:hypothetical protein
LELAYRDKLLTLITTSHTPRKPPKGQGPLQLTNRVGDTLLTVCMFAILCLFGNIDYSTVFALAPYYNENIIVTG